MEKYGGICDCQSSRDTFLYAASVHSSGLRDTVEVLGDVVLRPQLPEDEVEMTRMAVQYELEDATMRPDQEPFMVEAIHAAAYNNNTLGLPKLCPVENLGTINRQTLTSYLGNYHTPERMVLAGVGVEHDVLVRAAEDFFEKKPASWVQPEKKRKPDESLAQYTGGLVTVEKDLSNVSLGPTPMPNLAHLTIGLESTSHQHPDFIAFCVLNMMMGGGGSFSAGGPGKGMYTRLYTHVLNRCHWMYSCTAMNHAYADSGVFTINASAPPNCLGDAVKIVTSEMVKLTGRIGEEEFERAKKQLKSMLLMNLEARPVVFEDVARHVLSQGKRNRPEYYIEQIDAVTSKDLNRIAEKMLSSKPSVAAIGDLTHLQDFKDIELALIDKPMNKEQKFSLFR